MPVVFRESGYRFFFYANEGDPREPQHVHVLKDGIEAKFWLWPEVRLAYNDGFNVKALRELSDLIVQHRAEIARAWDEFFDQR
jgi:hypothetical protein